jgi:hypothetical protein
MANAARRLKYEDYADDLPGLLERVANEHETVELERKDGKVIRIESVGLPKHDPEEVRAALRKAAGAFKNIDTEELKRDLREMGYQDTTHRPWLK